MTKLLRSITSNRGGEINNVSSILVKFLGAKISTY